MKTMYLIVAVVVVSIAAQGFQNIAIQPVEYNVEATFIGVTDDEKFEFVDDEEDFILFDEIKPGLEIDLSDEMYVDRTFLITYTEEEIETVNEKGEPTGKTKLYRSIIGLREL